MWNNEWKVGKENGREGEEHEAHNKDDPKECNPQIVGNGATVELGESRNQVQEGETVYRMKAKSSAASQKQNARLI